MKTTAQKTMQFTEIERDRTFRVESASGTSYEIAYAGSGDGDPDYVALWECSCPGYQYRGSCKHVDAFCKTLPGMSVYMRRWEA